MKIQDPLERAQAFELSIEWLENVLEHVAAWEAENSEDTVRKPLHLLVKRICDSCRGAYALTNLKQYEQAGALMRVAIENLWLLDLFGSEHPKASETLKRWINGEKVQPASIRKMISEGLGDSDPEIAMHRQFMNDCYAELCGFIHPQATSPSASLFERNLTVVLTDTLSSLPVFLSKFEIQIPHEFSEHGNILSAMIPVLLTAHLPQDLRNQVLEFAAAMCTLSLEGEDDCDEV